MTVDAAKREVESLEKKLRHKEAEVREWQKSRPPLALAAQRGDGGPLQKLDGQIEVGTREIETLQDALFAARWGVKRAGEGAVRPLVENTQAQWKKLRSGLSALLSGIAQYREARAELEAKVKELGVRGVSAPGPEYGIVIALNKALNIKVKDLFISDGVQTLDEEELAFKNTLEEFARLAALPGPKKKLPPRLEDQPDGGFAAMNAESRRAGLLP